jgi:hypothetical protein
LAEPKGKHAVIVLDIFEVCSMQHEIFEMPMLAQCHKEQIYAIISVGGYDSEGVSGLCEVMTNKSE